MLLRALPFLLACLLIPETVAGPQEFAPEKSSDEKIAFYRARIGGPATYPAHARLGLAYLQKFRETGQARFYDEGLRSLKRSLSYQRNYEALLGLAVGLAERHYFKEALPVAEEATAANPTGLEASAALFDIHLALGNVVKAEQTLNGMLRVQQCFQSLTRLAALREYRGDLSGALEAMEKAPHVAAGILSKTTAAWAETRIGSLQLARCEVEKAHQAYFRSLALVPGYSFANEHLAEWHAARGQWKEAEKLFRQLLKSRPEPLYRVGLAEACRQQAKVREAKRQLEKAVAELRQSAEQGAQDPFRLLALLLLERGDTQEAWQWAQRDWDVRQDALTADTLAWAHHANGQGAEAIRLSELALQSGSKHPALLLHGGLIQCRWGNREKGRALLEQALACPLAFGPHERSLAESARSELRVR